MNYIGGRWNKCSNAQEEKRSNNKFMFVSHVAKLVWERDLEIMSATPMKASG